MLEQLRQKLEAAESNLQAMLQAEQAAHERRLRQEGAVLTLRMLVQEQEAVQGAQGVENA